MAHKKSKHKGGSGTADRFTRERRTFGHGRKPPHHLSPPMAEGRSGPMPSENEFSPEQEQAMRAPGGGGGAPMGGSMPGGDDDMMPSPQ